MMAHTPGPWKRINRDICHVVETPRGGHSVLRIARVNSGPSIDIKANGDLLAAAPDLLAALTTAERHLALMAETGEVTPACGQAAEKARAAIAMTKGECR
jgi:hypothetical protein